MYHCMRSYENNNMTVTVSAGPSLPRWAGERGATRAELVCPVPSRPVPSRLQRWPVWTPERRGRPTRGGTTGARSARGPCTGRADAEAAAPGTAPTLRRRRNRAVKKVPRVGGLVCCLPFLLLVLVLLSTCCSVKCLHLSAIIFFSHFWYFFVSSALPSHSFFSHFF